MKRRTLLGLASAVLIAACHGRELSAQAGEGAGPLAARLLASREVDWRTFDRPHVVIHVLKGSQADMDAMAIGDSVRAIRSELLQRLEIPAQSDSTNPAHIFFVDSREMMQGLAGRPLMGFVQRDEATGVFVYLRGYNTGALLRHELTHLYTFQYWGAPRAGAWLVEGIAVWEGGLCQGHTPHELAAGVRARGDLVPLTELSNRFRDLPEDVAMPQAGSITGFLVESEGLRGVRDRWTRANDSGTHPLGRGGPQLEAAWISALEATQPASLDIPSLLSRGC